MFYLFRYNFKKNRIGTKYFMPMAMVKIFILFVKFYWKQNIESHSYLILKWSPDEMIDEYST